MKITIKNQMQQVSRETLILFTISIVLSGHQIHAPRLLSALENPKSACGVKAKHEYLLAYAENNAPTQAQETLQNCSESLPVLQERISAFTTLLRARLKE